MNKTSQIFVLVVNCGDPGDVANGIRKTDDGFTYLSTIKYFCNPGFVLKGSREQVCQEDGKWTGTKPTCISKLFRDKYIIHDDWLNSTNQ